MSKLTTFILLVVTGFVALNAGESSSSIGNFSRLCVLDSTGCAPRLYSFYPERALCVEIKCFRSLESLTPAQEIAFNLISRAHRIRNFSAHKFAQNHKLSGRNLLVDEYSIAMPFLWKLKNPYELKQVIKHLEARFKLADLVTGQKVPLLIALDYGHDQSQDLCAKQPCKSLDLLADNQITSQEADFLRQYFNILSSNEAAVVFSLYHTMLSQIENMKLSIHAWNDNKSWLFKVSNLIKECLKDLGLGEVVYRFFLIQMIVVLSQISGLGLGKKIKHWILQGARRGCPGHCVVEPAVHHSEHDSVSSSSSSLVLPPSTRKDN